MSNLPTNKKIELIHNSKNIDELPISAMPIPQSEQYYFVSYSHKDYKEVYTDILRLQDAGLNIWYDRGLPAGKNWEDVVEEHINKYACVGIIFYLSENSLLSDAIFQEISFVKAKNKDYLSINLPINGQFYSAEEMLNNLSEKVQISNDKKEQIKNSFSNKVLFIPYDADSNFKAEKIKLLKTPPLLSYSIYYSHDNLVQAIVSAINSIEAKTVVIPECYKNNKNKYFVSGIGKSAFANCRNLINIQLPKYQPLFFVENSAFYGCSKLQKVDGFNTIINFGDYSFADCVSLQNVFFSDIAKKIGNFAFKNCKSLLGISIGSFINKIGEGAFCGSGIKNIIVDIKNPRYKFESGCLIDKTDSSVIYACGDENGNLYIPNGVKIIKRYAAFNSPYLKNVFIPSSVEVIEEFAFESALNLELVINLKSKNKLKILANAFAGCKSLEKVILNSNLSYLGPNVFINCQSLNSIQFTNNCKLTQISSSCFENCISLKSILIPRNVTILDNSAFANCKSLNKIEFSKNSKLKIIEKGAISYCDIKNLVLPSSIRHIKERAINCSNLESIQFESLSKLSIIDNNGIVVNNIKKITYGNTIKKWKQISQYLDNEFNDANTPLEQLVMVFALDGIVS